MDSPNAPLDFRVTLKGQTQGHADFKALYFVMEPMLLLTINRKAYMAGPMTP